MVPETLCSCSLNTEEASPQFPSWSGEGHKRLFSLFSADPIPTSGLKGCRRAEQTLSLNRNRNQPKDTTATLCSCSHWFQRREREREVFFSLRQTGARERTQGPILPAAAALLQCNAPKDTPECRYWKAGNLEYRNAIQKQNTE